MPSSGLLEHFKHVHKHAHTGKTPKVTGLGLLMTCFLISQLLRGTSFLGQALNYSLRKDAAEGRLVTHDLPSSPPVTTLGP